MEFIITSILLLTFIPVFIPFKKTQSDIQGLHILIVTYLIYLALFFVFVYLVLIKELSFGFELGDLVVYAVSYLVMIIANLGLAMRNSTRREIKYIFSFINFIASIYIIHMLTISNIMK